MEPLTPFALRAVITATHCCVCRRRLLDAESVETGLGPICSKRYYDPVHTPSEAQVAEAIGHLQVANLPDSVIDAVLLNQGKARIACNHIVYFASAHYEDRDMVFKCSRIIRAFGYKMLADKLEEDRVKVSIKTGKVDPAAPTDSLIVAVPYKLAFQTEAAWVPQHSRLPDEGRKVRWVFPTSERPFVEALLGVHFGGDLAFGDQGLFNLCRAPRRILDTFLHKAKSPNTKTILPVRIVDNGARDVEFWGPYNPKAVDDLKAKIPSADRRWDATTRCWRIHRRHVTRLKDLAQAHYGVTL